jgi:hypothetical protein
MSTFSGVEAMHFMQADRPFIASGPGWQGSREGEGILLPLA